MSKYSIGIVTFEKRFEEYFKPLIKSIKNYRPDIEITVCVNGEHKKDFNQAYLKDILNFLSNYSKIYPQIFTEFNSLAKLWNRVILNSTNNLVLVLNDDVRIEEGFFDLVESNISSFKNKLTLINGIFSHFIIDRQYLSTLNWFDERFLGVGKEDRDIQQKTVQFDLNTNLIYSYHIETTKPIHEMKVYGNKYSKFNENFYFEKWGNKIHPEYTQYPYFNFELNNKSNL